MRELTLLCCALLFLFLCFFSLLSGDRVGTYSLTLCKSTANALDLVETSQQKVESDEHSAALTPFYFEPIPINYCGKDLLLSVSGIGPVLAESILETRERIGSFRTQADLLQVSGIGESRMNLFASSFSFNNSKAD